MDQSLNFSVTFDISHFWHLSVLTSDSLLSLKSVIFNIWHFIFLILYFGHSCHFRCLWLNFWHLTFFISVYFGIFLLTPDTWQLLTLTYDHLTNDSWYLLLQINIWHYVSFGICHLHLALSTLDISLFFWPCHLEIFCLLTSDTFDICLFWHNCHIIDYITFNCFDNWHFWHVICHLTSDPFHIWQLLSRMITLTSVS